MLPAKRKSILVAESVATQLPQDFDINHDVAWIEGMVGDMFVAFAQQEDL